MNLIAEALGYGPLHSFYPAKLPYPYFHLVNIRQTAAPRLVVATI